MSYVNTLLVLLITFLSFSVDFTPEDNGQKINHLYYSLSYNEDTEQANWVFYLLTKEMLNGDVKRSSNFRNDPLVFTKSATTNDYTKSGYDRGHLCPAGDMAFDSIAMYESFYMSNISPQIPAFNRGIWKELETKVRVWTQNMDSAYVITGPIFDGTDIRIGNNMVKVPAYFYKVLYAPKQNKMIAFILPNKASNLPIERFVSTVDSLENIIGIDFFSQLPDMLEDQLESKIVLAGWFSTQPSLSDKTQKSNLSLYIFLLVMAGIVLIVIILRKRK